MKAIRAYELRSKFKEYADMAVGGETIVVARPNNKNVVVISEDAYNTLIRSQRNEAYLAQIDASLRELEEGKGIVKSLSELEAMTNG